MTEAEARATMTPGIEPGTQPISLNQRTNGDSSRIEVAIINAAHMVRHARFNEPVVDHLGAH